METGKERPPRLPASGSGARLEGAALLQRQELEVAAHTLAREADRAVAAEALEAERRVCEVEVLRNRSRERHEALTVGGADYGDPASGSNGHRLG